MLARTAGASAALRPLTSPGAGRLVSADGPVAAIGRNDLPAHTLASMNLEVVSDHPLRGRSK